MLCLAMENVQKVKCGEAAMAAAHYKLDNLCVFLDLNGLQIDGKTRRCYGF